MPPETYDSCGKIAFDYASRPSPWYAGDVLDKLAAERAAYPEGIYEALQKAAERLAAERAAAQSKLTEDQFIEAMRQALACGDFLQLVRPDGAQCLTYEPFREVTALKARVAGLEAKLQRVRDALAKD